MTQARGLVDGSGVVTQGLYGGEAADVLYRGDCFVQQREEENANIVFPKHDSFWDICCDDESHV